MKKEKFLEIFFDAENVSPGYPIGSVTRGLWSMVCWDLNEDGEPIIDSGVIIIDKASLTYCQNQAVIYADDLKEHGYRVCVSGNSPDSKFPLRPVWYEMLTYHQRRI